jgi:LCP family protein required for cell wall assembly
MRGGKDARKGLRCAPMGDARPVVRPRRSAFAAAFLSFLYPGLGHAYLGRWLRALLWAILPTLAIVVGAGLILSAPDKTELVAPLLDPAMSTMVYGAILVDLLYRLAAVFDAYRLARDPSVGSGSSRMLSTVGLLGIVLVLIASHVAVARPVGLAYDTINEITSNSGDDTELPDAGDLEALGIQIPDASFEPEATLAAEELGTVDEDEPTPTPSAGPGWDGKQRLNILLVGADGGRQGIADKSYLTDTMIVVSVDPRTGKVAFISLPRDMSGIPIPRDWPAYRAYGGKYTDKINTLYTAARASRLFPGNDRERGYEALMGVLGQLYGLKIDYYVAVDLNSFRDTINTLGGVVVDVQVPLYDSVYPSADGRGNLKLYVPPGMQWMNGQRALAYARSRHGPGSSDFERSARQQRVVTSIRDQTDLSSLFAPGVIDKLLKQLTKSVRTNIPARMIPRLISLAQEIDLDRRDNLVLSSSAYGRICYPCPPNGYWMLIANPANIRKAVQNVLAGNVKAAKERKSIASEGAVVHVLNGAGGSNAKTTNIADALKSRGMNALVPPVAEGRADNDDYKDTVITVYNGAAADIAKTLKKLRATFKGAQVVEADDPEQVANIAVIVGKKTKPLKKQR